MATGSDYLHLLPQNLEAAGGKEYKLEGVLLVCALPDSEGLLLDSGCPVRVL